MTLPTTTQFRSATTPSGKKAYEAYVAIYENCGKNVMIGAPTLALLEEIWKGFSPQTLVIERAQHVWIVKVDSEMKDAPDVKPAAASVACHFCGRQASFIIHRIATCERRECKEKANGR
jgi:hypothetical protein